MGKILKFPSLDQYLAGLVSSGGVINNKIIKHYEVEKMAAAFDVYTSVELVNCDLTKSCAVVKAVAKHQGCIYESFGEVSPLPYFCCRKKSCGSSCTKSSGDPWQILFRC